MKFPVCVRNTAKCLFGLLAAATLTGCDDTIYDYEGDCDPKYRVEFRYDRNLKYADAFAKEVKSVSLCLFDQGGKFVKQFRESGSALSTGTYQMPIDIAPGTYNLVTWAGLEGHASFSVPAMTPGESTIEQLKCALAYAEQQDGTGLVDKYLAEPGSLFHAYDTNVTFPNEEGTHVIPVSLTKNTKSIRVVLQHLSGESVNADDFTFSIENIDNSLMAHDNTLIANKQLVYKPFQITTGTAGVISPESGAETQVAVAVAEFSIGRLVKDVTNPILVVRNKDNEVALSIPLIEYVLLVKAYEHSSLTDQEYLERQDDYSMTFFLDSSNRWDKVHININGWAIVINNTSLG